jgi:hypothetical protein
MPHNRMNRDEFYSRLAGLDEEQLKKALWNLYWRGAAPMRERIEAELSPVPAARRPATGSELPDPARVLEEVSSFTELARSGAYIAGSRQVSAKERSGWRFTFRRLAEQASRALAAQQSEPAEQAVATLVSLACSMKDMEYFRSGDAVEAARFVVSDEVAALWTAMIRRVGSHEFTRLAAPQLIRWESEYGWTRTGYGRISEKETQLAHVLARLLVTPDAWVDFTDRYLEALDRLAPAPHAQAPGRGRLASSSAFDESAYRRAGRTAALATWHGMLLDRLPDYDAADRLDRLAVHPALGGAELLLLRARWACRNGALDQARALATEALDQLPGHHELLAFATEIGAELPKRAQRVVGSRI